MQINAEFEEDEEDDEEEDMSLWGQFVNNMRGGRRGRDHKGQRPQHGGRKGRQGPPHHGGRHQRGERPPMMEEDEEDEEFFGRPRPMGPRVRSERPEGPEHEGRHHGKGDRGHHGKSGKGHHARNIRMMRLMKLLHSVGITLGAALFAGHFWMIKKLKTAQDAEEKITGPKKGWGWGKCGWKKNKCGGRFQQQTHFVAQPAQQQQVVIEYSPVHETSINTESSIEEISEDKQEFAVYAPAPTGMMIINQNQMV
jgi:hypothetical protein